eukprot:g24534.t1
MASSQIFRAHELTINATQDEYCQPNEHDEYPIIIVRVILGRPNYIDAPKPFDDPGGARPGIDAELSTKIVRQALRLLWHCGNSTQGRVEAIQANGAACITQFLSHHDAKVREAAVCALNVISLETRGKKDVLEHSLEAIGRIIHSESETTYLHETCVWDHRSEHC